MWDLEGAGEIKYYNKKIEKTAKKKRKEKK